MPETCMACSSFAKFLIRDGSHKKDVCTLHMIKYQNEGYEVIRALTIEERKRWGLNLRPGV